MHVRPQIVYKYKSISTQTDFNRVVDIIKSKHRCTRGTNKIK